MTGVGTDVTALDFSRIKGKLYGRSEELSVLRQAYLRTCSSARLPPPAELLKGGDEDAKHRNSEAVLVSGQSGTGKSSLVERALRDEPPRTQSDTIITARHFFVSGKFDQRQQAEPYSAISAAFTDLCNQIISDDDPQVRSAMRASVKDAIWPEGAVIANVVPNLTRMFDEEKEQGQGQEQENLPMNSSVETLSSNTDAQIRFRHAFRAFVRAVCSKSHVTVFLDDLQWADIASLDLIQSLLTDAESTNLLFVGSYRSEELGSLDGRHPLAVRLRDIETRQAVKLSRIHVESSDRASVNELISDLLRLDPDQTLSLTDVVYKKTNGNIFFVLRFLEALQEGGLLYLSFQTLKWIWANTEEIESKMEVADNVVDLVTAKLRRLPSKVRSTVSLASCLGCQFSTDMLETVIDACDHGVDASLPKSCDSHSHDLVAVLEVASGEGVIEQAVAGVRRRGSYRFVHDRIQQAAYSLLPAKPEDRDMLHARIGHRLWQKFLSMEDEGKRRNVTLMFAAVNQLNHGLVAVTKYKERIALAKLNLEAGEFAAVSSAFVPAAEYLSTGIKLLKGTGSWKSNYDLSLRIYTKSAECEQCIGNFQECRRLSDEVLENALSPCDKARAYRVVIDSLLAQKKFVEAMNLGFKVLRETGERFPRSVYLPHIAFDFLKTKRMLREMTEEDFLNLPPMASETKYTAMTTLIQVLVSAMFLNSAYVPLLIFRTVQLTVKQGLCKLSPVALSGYGGLLCRFGDLKEGYRFAKLAMTLQERFDTEFYAMITQIMYVLVAHWQEPLSQSLEHLLKSHEVGMRSGDIRHGMFCAQAYCVYYVYSGIGPLGPIEKDMRAYSELMTEYGQEPPLQALLPMWQFVLNMMGQTDDPLILTGEAMDEESMLKDAEGTGNTANIFHLNCLKMDLAYHFGYYELAATFTESRWTQDNKIQGHFEVCRHGFVSGLISLALAKKTGRRKWLRRACKIMKIMTKWVRLGAGNVLHMLLLLQAERATLRGKEQDVKKAFDAAIAAASRNGFRHDHALANERAGLFFFEIKDEFWASFYLSKSYEVWNDWGAKAKADHLLRSHLGIINAVDVKEAGSGRHKGRSRFTNESVKHKTLSIDRIVDNE